MCICPPAERSYLHRLLCFGDVGSKLGLAGGVRRERRTVRLTDIVGSVSRCSEFDGAFLPLREGARIKWERIDRRSSAARSYRR